MNLTRIATCPLPYTHLLGVELQEHVMALAHTVLVGPAALPPSLKVLSTYEAAVDVDRRKGDGTELLKVEVEQMAVDLEGRRKTVWSVGV